MKIDTLPVGALETNCYIVGGENGAVVIDPGAEAEKILDFLGGKRVYAILLTHGHFDHIGAVARLKEETAAPVYMHKNDEEMITDINKSLGFMTGEEIKPFCVDRFVADSDTLTFDDLTFSVLHTPGHSGGGVTYAAENAVFCGDLIFRGSIGRYDFGSFADEMKSVRRVLSSFPDSAALYPGHGGKTDVGYEKKYNPYVKNGESL